MAGNPSGLPSHRRAALRMAASPAGLTTINGFA